MLIRRLAVSLLFLCFTYSAAAHNRSESFSEWSLQGSILSYSFSVLEREVTRIPPTEAEAKPLADVLVEHLSQTLSASMAGEACAVDRAIQALPSREGYLRAEGRFICGNLDSVNGISVNNVSANVSLNDKPQITINSFFDLLATHTHYAKVRHQGQVNEFLFTQSQRTQQFSTEGTDSVSSLSNGQAFSEYLWIGAEHILGGIDHLAFVFALILLAAGWKEMAWLVTGFTLGHSISLILAVLQIAKPNSLMVEALIGFTIVLVVVEAIGERTGRLWQMAPAFFWGCLIIAGALGIWALDSAILAGVIGIGLFASCYLRVVAVSQQRARWRLMITSVFGLIHGFGFAGGLLETGFPTEQLAFVLIGFNLGVELGQLLVLALVVACLLIARRYMNAAWLMTGSNMIAASLSALGCFWFITRLFA